MSDDKMHERATTIIAAYLGANRVDVGELPTLIGTVYDGLRSADRSDDAAATAVVIPAAGGAARKLTPAEIKRTITDEAIICLECGKRTKAMRMHLVVHKMTDKEYLAKWGLPADYPMVAPSYGRKRSAQSKAIRARTNNRS